MLEAFRDYYTDVGSSWAGVVLQRHSFSIGPSALCAASMTARSIPRG